jgi:hypothetical protein
MGQPDFITSLVHLDVGTGEVCGLVVLFVWIIVRAWREIRQIFWSGTPKQGFRALIRFSTSIDVEFQPKGEKNMQARILRIGVGVGLLLTGYMAGTYTSTSIRAEQRTSVPGYYGRLVAGDSSSLWFEDKDGTLRQVNVPQGNTVFTAARTK